MSQAASEQYPRTLYEWTKSDDKILHKALVEGRNVIDLAEDLQREHVSILNRLNDLDLFQFDSHSEEWVEIMGLGLGGAPLKPLIDWCTGSDDRLMFDDLESMTMSDMRPELALARELRIIVANSTVIEDLTWLHTQPAQVQAGYAAAIERLTDRLDVVTPLTLKNEVLGIVVPLPRPCWNTAARKTTTASKSAPAKRYYRKSPTTTTAARYAKKRTGRYSKRSYAH